MGVALTAQITVDTVAAETGHMSALDCKSTSMDNEDHKAELEELDDFFGGDDNSYDIMDESYPHAIDDDNLDENATKEDAIVSASRCVWGVLSLHLFQITAIVIIMIIFNACWEKKLLLVEHTGGGKSMTAMLVVGWRNIVSHYTPLLSLTADSLNKVRHANQQYGTFEAHHIDEIKKDQENMTPF